MSELVTKKCDADGCQSVKRETNKWWIALEHPIGVFFTTADMVHQIPEVFDRDGFVHWDACSEQCLQKILGRWTSKAQLPAVLEMP